MKIVGHGIDVVDIEKIIRLVEDAESDFLIRCFTRAEREDVQNHSDRSQYLAGRFAAKEAVAKAIATGFDGSVSPVEIEILNQRSGLPSVTLYGAAAEVAERLGISLWRISISHADTVAVASAIALGND